MGSVAKNSSNDFFFLFLVKGASLLMMPIFSVFEDCCNGRVRENGQDENLLGKLRKFQKFHEMKIEKKYKIMGYFPPLLSPSNTPASFANVVCPLASHSYLPCAFIVLYYENGGCMTLLKMCLIVFTFFSSFGKFALCSISHFN